MSPDIRRHPQPDGGALPESPWRPPIPFISRLVMSVMSTSRQAMNTGAANRTARSRTTSMMLGLALAVAVVLTESQQQ